MSTRLWVLAAAVGLSLLSSGCGRQQVWRHQSGEPFTKKAFTTDAMACRQTAGKHERVFINCMSARGWEASRR